MINENPLDFLESFYIKKTPRDGRHLVVMTRLLNMFNINLTDFKIVQITGSCGKGSTAAFISSILSSAGITHGLFTGPHLIDYEERFVINGKQITKDDFARIVLEIKKTLASNQVEHVGHMHLMILIAFLWFKELNIELVVFENGAGGASDPSNVFDPIVACMTEITLDHTHLLGNTIEEITQDKAAIIKPKTAFVVCGMQNEVARKTLLQREESSDEHYKIIHRDYSYEVNKHLMDYHSEQLHLTGIVPGLEGEHQFQNAANAICVIEGLLKLDYSIEIEAIRTGIEMTKWPGRLEIFSDGLYLDGAHNPYELKTLNNSLAKLGINPETILISFASRKNIEDMLKALDYPNAHYIVVPSPFLERRQSQAVVEAAFTLLHIKFTYQEDLIKAWTLAQDLNRGKESLLVTGSLYLVGEIRRLLLEKEVNNYGR